MVIAFRHGDPRFPFFVETDSQPAARWHAAGEGPVQYLADTPDGAWAEFLRHEEITDPADLAGVRRRVWAIELDLSAEVEMGTTMEPSIGRADPWSYPECQAVARDLRRSGATCLRALSAALQPGAARGQITDGGLREAAERDGVVWALIGPRRNLRGWAAADGGAPTERVLDLVAHFDGADAPATAAV